MTLQMGNKGAFIRFEAPDLKPNIVTFSAVVGVHFYNMVFPVYHLFFFFFFFFFFLDSFTYLSFIDIAAAS